MQIIVLYVFATAGGLGLAFMFWMLAFSTRKTRVCKHCGEKVVSEQMDAETCPTCGTPL